LWLKLTVQDHGRAPPEVGHQRRVAHGLHLPPLRERGFEHRRRHALVLVGIERAAGIEHDFIERVEHTSV
jgi:hypothetical protein